MDSDYILPVAAEDLQGLDAVLVDPAKAKLETTERQLAAKMELQDALATRTLALSLGSDIGHGMVKNHS